MPLYVEKSELERFQVSNLGSAVIIPQLIYMLLNVLLLLFKNCSGQKMCRSQSVEWFFFFGLFFCLLGKTCDNNEKCSDLYACVCGVAWRTLG